MSQTEMGEALGGVKQGAYSNYENDTRPVPEGMLEKAKALYRDRMERDWPADQSITGAGGIPSAEAFGTPYVTPALPGEHAAQAWEILHEAARAGGADIMAMDVKAVGEILGAIADAVAMGRGEEARLRAVRRAEVILKAVGKAAP